MSRIYCKVGIKRVTPLREKMSEVLKVSALVSSYIQESHSWGSPNYDDYHCINSVCILILLSNYFGMLISKMSSCFSSASHHTLRDFGHIINLQMKLMKDKLGLSPKTEALSKNFPFLIHGISQDWFVYLCLFQDRVSLNQ